MLSRLLTIAFCSYCWLLSPDAARAQTRPGHEPAGYKEAVSRAVDEFGHNNYEEAREHFARAHALFPNARTFRGMGMSEFELRNYVDAVNYLEQALSSEVKPLEARLRDETVSLLRSAQQYVGTVQLRLEPASSTVTLDGIPVKWDRAQGLRIAVGDRLLEFRAEGYLSERRAIKIRGEQVLEVTIKLARTELEPSAKDTSTSAPLAKQTERGTPVYKTWWLWTTIGLAAAGGAVAAVLLTQKSKHEEATTTDNTPPNGVFQPLWSR